MLRVTVTRENSTETTPIGEVVIGKFSGSEQRGGYAARVLEPPSQYSDGIDACFAVRGHERYQPAMALVASVMAAWSEGRVDQVCEGIRSALNIATRTSPIDLASPEGIGDLHASLAQVAAGGGPNAESAKLAGELLRNAEALARALIESAAVRS